MLIIISNIYNSHNNIKFTKKKNYPILYFLKVKYYTKKKKNDKDKSLHIPHSKY